MQIKVGDTVSFVAYTGPQEMQHGEVVEITNDIVHGTEYEIQPYDKKWRKETVWRTLDEANKLV